MEYTRIGNHKLTVCPHCDKLFHLHVADDTEAAASLDKLSAMYQQHINLSPSCREARDALPSMEDLQKTLGPAFRQADQECQARLDNHPNNGTLGYWLVEGIRHDARCKAHTAREAVKKCAGTVGDWESPEVTFIGIELPEVF